jgi:flagellar motility protein MotE (MotC chaperone)
MEFRPRLVPLLIAAALGLLTLKLGDLWSVLSPAPVAMAQAPVPPAAKPPAAGATPAAPAAPAPAATPPAATPAPGAAPAAAAAPANGAPADKPQSIDPLSMSPSEIDLLQKLSERRAALEKRDAELSQREVLLQATEKRIDEKIAKLAAIEKDIGGIVDKQNQEDDARLKSLVKIYETMKPHDAARIFEQLDMPVLLGVVEHMKEMKAAPILASMDPAKARAVTLALAERRDTRNKDRMAAQGTAAAPSSTP